jgi:5-formyltetrahydrofolate cyclo-ligase
MFYFLKKSFCNKIIMNQNLNKDLSNVDFLKDNLRKVYKKLRNEKSESLKENPEEKYLFLNKLEANLNKLIYSSQINSSSYYIACYYPIQNEIDSLNLLKNLQKKNKNEFNIIICLPRTCQGNKHLKFYEYTGEDNLIQGKYKIMEPNQEKCNEVLPNLIITPLLAFDKNKNRLGYGKGHYDNTFINLRKQNHNFISVGLAYDEQYSEQDLPFGEFDQTLDYIITPNKFLF